MTKKCGVILAGGKGTRLSPATKAICKQLLPVYNKPMIYYPLTTLMRAGIKDIMIISTPMDIHRFHALFGDGSDLGIQLNYSIQAEPKGIADAFYIAESFIDDRCTALILGDNLFFGSQLDDVLGSDDLFRNGATVFGMKVKNPERYGVADFDEKGVVRQIVEKPSNPPSSYAVTGLYCYDKEVMSFVKDLKPSVRGELEITDLNNCYIEKQQLKFVKFAEGVSWFDSGTHQTLLEASQFVQAIENHNTLIGAPEKIAYEKGWIDKAQLQKIIDKMGLGDYRKHLESLL